MQINAQKTALVTGSAGFIGFHTAKRLIKEGWRVVGVDCMSDNYDVELKKRRESILLESSAYRSVHAKIEEQGTLLNVFSEEKPEIVVHLAGQAGVRQSTQNPRSHLESNIMGTFEILEAARAYPPQHMLIASTSSAYGANEDMPYRESAMADHQMSFYAATKKSTENMAHSYSHLFNLPITMFRFFTVYGPWGRPDMALFKFTKAIINGEPVDVYNHGKMSRDFTYIDDLVNSLFLLIDVVPVAPNYSNENIDLVDSRSLVAPYRVINVGNSTSEELLAFITAIELSVGRKAILNLMPMQLGDVPCTWADTSLLQSLINYKPNTNLTAGVQKFVSWYREYYKV